MDRAGAYKFFQAADCSGTQITTGVAVSGGCEKNTAVTATLQISFDSIVANGSAVTLCVQDTAGYKFASRTLNIMPYVEAINELSGGGGLNLDGGQTAEFPLFQSNWTSGTANRGNGTGGAVLANGIDSAYSHSVYLDPKDGYKLKYFVADRDNHRIMIFNTLPTNNAAAADVVIGQANLTTGGATAANAGGAISASGFNQPLHVSVSGSGILFVTDLLNNRVLVYNRIPVTNGATADYAIGQPGFTTGTANNGSVPLAARLNNPAAAVVIEGKLFIADQANNRIIVFNTPPTSNGASADYVIGQSNLSSTAVGTNYVTQNNYLDSPYDILAYAGRLYVADGGNHRVLVYTSIPTASDARPVYVIGHTGPGLNLANRGGTTAINGLNQPRSLAAQGNKLAIADQGNNRVLFFNLPINADDPDAAYVLGQSNFVNFAASTAQRTFSTVKGLIFDSGYIWVGDRVNNRVQVLQLPY